MRVLFLMDSPEYLRFYDTAIEALAARGHQVAIAVLHQRDRKPVGLGGLQAYADRVTVLGVVPAARGAWRDVGRSVRATMDFVRFLHPRFAGARALRARIKRKVLPRALHWLDRIPRLGEGVVRRLQRGLAAAEAAIPVPAAAAAFLHEQSPDLLLVSPLVTAASEQVDWIKAARAAGIRTAVCIASWDNLTNKGLLRIEPDTVLVWNEAQKREARDYHYIPEDKIVVTGAQQFDRWFARTPTRDRAAFCARAGLRDTGPFVLFTGSSSFISESNTEVAFVRRWVAALRASAAPELRAVHVVVRPHPYNFHRWADAPVADLPGVTVYPARPFNPVAPESRDDFFDSLHHSAAVVGINTSAMIEAAIVGRPVCSLLTPEFSGTQEGTIHFHHLLPDNGGFLRLAATLDEHVAQLAHCLANPEAMRQETARFVRSFVRPHGIDRPATPAFADAVERAAAAPRPVPAPAGAGQVLLRPLVLGVAWPVVLWQRLTDPGLATRLRKEGGSRLRQSRKALARAGKRWRKYVKEAW
jgi:hypothetical protein